MRNKLPLASIMVINFNGEDYILPCLKSVLKTAHPNFEVIFIDNNSDDKSLTLVKKKFNTNTKIKIVASNKNLGAAGGYNFGASFAKGKYLVFLNNDLEVEKNWLSELIAVLEDNPGIGAAGGRQLLIRDRTKIDGLGGFLDRLGFVYPLVAHGEKDRGQYHKINRVFTCGSTAIIVRKDLFNLVGGFDEDYFIIFEDNDLCWRIHLAGFKVVSVSSAIIYHHASGTLKRFPKPEPFYLTERNRIMTLIKNYDLKNLLLFLPALIALEFFQVFVLLIRGRFNFAWAIIKSLKDVLLNIRTIWVKRKRVQKMRKIQDKVILESFVKFNPGNKINLFLKTFSHL